MPLNVIASPPQGIRDVFDLMPTDTARATGRTIADPPHQGAGRPRAVDIESLRGRRRPGQRQPRAARSTACIDQCDRAHRRRRLLRHLRSPGASAAARPLDDAVRADLERRRRGRGRRPTPQLGRRPAHASCSPRPPRPTPRAASATQLASRALPRRHRRPRGDLRLGAGRSWPASPPSMERRGRADPARRHGQGGHRASSTPTRRYQLHGTDALQRLDAGARRRGHRRAWPARTSTSPSRCAPSSAGSRRPTTGGIYYTGPERRLQPPGPDVVVGAQGRHRVRHLARADDRLPRGRARATTSRSPRPSTAASCSTGGAGSMCWTSGPRRGLGALRRAADGRAGLPGRPGQPPGHARRPVAARRPRGARHRRALRLRGARRGRWRRAGPTTRRGRSSTPHANMGEELLRFELNRYLGWPGQAPSLQDRRAALAAAARRGPAPARATRSTSRTSTAARSTSAASASTPCGRPSSADAAPGGHDRGPGAAKLLLCACRHHRPRSPRHRHGGGGAGAPVRPVRAAAADAGRRGGLVPAVRPRGAPVLRGGAGRAAAAAAVRRRDPHLPGRLQGEPARHRLRSRSGWSSSPRSASAWWPGGCCRCRSPRRSRSAPSWRRRTRWPRPPSPAGSACPAGSSRSWRASRWSTTPPRWCACAPPSRR